MDDLPESFVKRGRELAAGARLFGKLISEMTRDELIAAAAQGWADERDARERIYGFHKSEAASYVEIAKFWRGAPRGPNV